MRLNKEEKEFIQAQLDDLMLPDIRKLIDAIELVKLGKSEACKRIWDQAKERSMQIPGGKVVKLEVLYRILFYEAGR